MVDKIALQKLEFFSSDFTKADPDVSAFVQKELHRQQNQIELIASENIVSGAVLSALANVTTNKYAEGYPGKRYYGGCEYVDGIENIAIERAKILFNCEYANVQPHSGSQANQVVFLALLNPGDTTLGMSLDAGGHLTHGAAPNLSGRWFNAKHYGVHLDTGLINYEQVEDLAMQHKPKLIIAGGSAYPRQIDFKKFREIADRCGAFLMADIAHYAGLIAAGLYPSPAQYADVITTTTHKTLRGPRGGMVLSNNQDLYKKLNSALFPGLQGGPIMNIITAKAVAFGEALRPDFKIYAKNVIENAQAMNKALQDRGYATVTDGTDCHLLLLDLTDKNITGKQAEEVLERAGLTCNKNTVPGETKSPFVTSGIRLGTPAGTTRGFNNKDFYQIGNFICDILDSLHKNEEEHHKVEKEVLAQVQKLCAQYPIYETLR